MNWKLVSEEGVPKPRIRYGNQYSTTEVSVDLLVSDGENVWYENYAFEIDKNLFKRSGITHYTRIDELEVPKS